MAKELVKKWLAWVDVKNSWDDEKRQAICHTAEVEVYETAKQFRTPHGFRREHDEEYRGLGYRDVISKDLDILHDSELDVLVALNDREYNRLQKNRAAIDRQEQEYMSIAEKILQVNRQ